MFASQTRIMITLATLTKPTLVSTIHSHSPANWPRRHDRLTILKKAKPNTRPPKSLQHKSTTLFDFSVKRNVPRYSNRKVREQTENNLQAASCCHHRRQNQASRSSGSVVPVPGTCNQNHQHPSYMKVPITNPAATVQHFSSDMTTDNPTSELFKHMISDNATTT